MGEYAIHNGQRVKIGTCENMYYLRADQMTDVHGEDARGNFGAEGLAVIRFRFPFPDEDGIEPGHFEDYGRGWKVPGGYMLPADLSGDEHRPLQFRHDLGYLVSIPCPEQFQSPGFDAMSGTLTVDGADEPYSFRVGRNGFSGGGAKVVQQAFRGGRLVTILHCGSCGAIHRLDTIEDALPVIEAFRDEAERTEWRRLASDWDEERGVWGDSSNYGHEPAHGEKARKELLEMAIRIAAGYATLTPERVS